MPPYQTTNLGNNPVGLLQPGVPAYAFGSRNAMLPPVRLAITGLIADGTTATLNVAVQEGNIPAVGDLISVAGTTASSGAFNVTNQPLTAVAINANTGIGTVSFLLAVTLSQTAQAGYATVKVSTTAEAIVDTEASQAFAIQDIAGHNENGKTITMQVVYPAANAPSTATMTLQVSEYNSDSEYSDAVSTTTLTNDIVEYPAQNVKFVRAKVTNLTGTTPKAIVRLSI